MLVVVLLLTLFLSIYDGELDHRGGLVSGSGLVAVAVAAVVAVVAVEDIYRRKRPATKASTVV